MLLPEDPHVVAHPGIRGQSLRCIELKTGKVMWNVDGFGAGTVTLARDRLVLLKENGELVMAPASPKLWSFSTARMISTNTRM